MPAIKKGRASKAERTTPYSRVLRPRPVRLDVSAPYEKTGQDSTPATNRMLISHQAEHNRNLEKINAKMAATKDGTLLQHYSKYKAFIQSNKTRLENEIAARKVLVDPSKDGTPEKEAAANLVAAAKANRKLSAEKANQLAAKRWGASNTYAERVASGASTKCPFITQNKARGDIGEQVDIDEAKSFMGPEYVVLNQVNAHISGTSTVVRLDYVVLDVKKAQIIAIGESKTNTAGFTKNQKEVFDKGKAFDLEFEVPDNQGFPDELVGKKKKITGLGADDIFVQRRVINNEE